MNNSWSDQNNKRYKEKKEQNFKYLKLRKYHDK